MQLGFYFDQTRCTGCYACAVACKDWNNIPAGETHWRRIISLEEGEWPDLFAAYLSISCSHCEDPICAVVCPAQAIAKREEDGIVLVDQDRCRQAARCGIISNLMDIPYGRTKSPCTIACPAGVNVQGYVGLIAKGRFKEARDLILRDLPLPSVCGRVCTHPCETVCKRQELDEPIAIMDLKRFVTDPEYPLPDPLPITKRQKVAVVGSGPAGISAAWGLAKRGYAVTIFETFPVAGGMLAVGLPEYRLPKEILKRDLDYIKALGIEIRTNSPIGDSLKLDDLKSQGYEAIFLAIGAHKGDRLSIPGARLKGVLTGVTFLREVNLEKKISLGNKVIVLGGGRVAFDCARAACRLNASEVHIACVEDRESMRALTTEIKQVEEEDIIIHNGKCFSKIHGKDGRACGVECLEVQSFSVDHTGQIQVTPIEGSEHIYEADTVIFAVGQSPDLSPFSDISICEAGTIEVSPQTMATNKHGIFAGGEAISGPISVIEAVAAGKRAAASIDAYLQGFIFREGDPLQDIEASQLEVEIPPEISRQPRQPMPIVPVTERKTWKEISLGFSEEAAVAEAMRCLNCAGHICREVCPYHAPQFEAESNAKMQMCNLCVDRWKQNKKPICVMACPTRAMDAGPLEDLMAKYGDKKEAEGFEFNPSTKPSVCFNPKQYPPISREKP